MGGGSTGRVRKHSDQLKEETRGGLAGSIHASRMPQFQQLIEQGGSERRKKNTNQELIELDADEYG